MGVLADPAAATGALMDDATKGELPDVQMGDRFWYECPDEPQFNSLVTVIRICGPGPDDIVKFDDGTHTKRKLLVGIPRAE